MLDVCIIRGYRLWQDRRVNNEEGYVRDIKANVGRKAKWNLEQACEGGV